MMKPYVVFAMLLCSLAVLAQSSAPAAVPADISGMYEFLNDGEFVQLTLNGSVLSGFISRYANERQDSFVDQFFEKAQWTSGALRFATQKSKGTWYEFSGTVRAVPGKTPREGYLLMSGTLTTHAAVDGKDTATAKDVEFKSFEAEDDTATPPPAK